MAWSAAAEVSRFARFAIVGGAAFLIDAGLLVALNSGLKLDPYTSRVISIAVAMLFTWRVNRAITFGASPTSQATEGLRYVTVAGLAACLNYAVYAAALLLWDALPPVAAAVIATLAAMTFSYLGYSRFVFHGSSPPARTSQRR